jgi:hypothetical protein
VLARFWTSRDWALAAAGLLLAAGIFYASRTYPQIPWADGGPPGFYPRFLATILAGLAILVAVEGWRRPAAMARPGGGVLGRMAAALALLAGATGALDWLGFLLTGGVLAFGLMLTLADAPRSRTRVLGFVLLAGAFVATLKLLFERVAGAHLPTARLLP